MRSLTFRILILLSVLFGLTACPKNEEKKEDSSQIDLKCNDSSSLNDSRCENQNLKWQNIASSISHKSESGRLGNPQAVF